MGLKAENMDKILELFYEYPGESFTVRFIEKKIRMPKSTVQKYLMELRKKGLIENNRSPGNNLFKFKKIHYFIEKIVKSGLLDYLEEELKSNCIILFGGMRKGESDKDSDIDLFVETYHKKKVDLARYDKKLGHKVELFLENNLSDLPENLQHNVINGIKLSGFLRVKK